MVPRAYLYSSPPATSPSAREKKDTMEITVTERAPKEVPPKERIETSPKPAKLLQASPATPSMPVVIPTRVRTADQRKNKEPALRIRQRPEADDSPHDPQSVPSSMAALLAMTTLPDSRYEKHQKHRRRAAHRATSDGARRGAASDAGRYAISTSNPGSWDMLQGSPNEPDQDSLSISSDTATCPLSSLRSLSSESMPSLVADGESTASVSNPSTPGLLIRTRSGGDKKQKTPSSSIAEDCILDHPLLPISLPQDFDSCSNAGDAEFLSPEVQPSTTAKLSFKSNLTASLRRLRSAARSFSNFTAPIQQRDDYLARSLLSISPQFTDERRPLPCMDLPDPALRRYLNPITVSPAELHIHHDHDQIQSTRNSCTTSIQLQTYQRTARPSKKSSSPPIFVGNISANKMAANEPEQSFTTNSLVTRQREPRENGDFLRIIVLEMNMRKVGKLSETTAGRARLWLPARQVSTQRAQEVETGGNGTPRRWIGVGV